MLKPKTKGLFVDISEFSILAARTSGFKLPMVVEELAEFPLRGEIDPDEVKSFFAGLVDLKANGYYVSRCGVYPEGRFVSFYEADSVNKAKDMDFLERVLKSEFGVNPDANEIAILDARDGDDYDPEGNLSKQLVFCGAPTEALRFEQEQLLSYGLYPERIEISSASTVGGISDYTKFREFRSPVLCLELMSSSANVFIVNGGKVDVTRSVPFGLDSIYPMLQRELGLKDEASARKLFFSNTFDFAEMGPKLLRRLTKELQASSGFYEVQTGQTIERVFVSVLPKNLSWVSQTVSDSLGMKILQPNIEPWLASLKIKMGEAVEATSLGGRWMGLFSLMGDFRLREGSTA